MPSSQILGCDKTPCETMLWADGTTGLSSIPAMYRNLSSEWMLQTLSLGLVVLVALVLVVVIGVMLMLKRRQLLKRHLRSAPKGNLAIMFTDIAGAVELANTNPSEWAVAEARHNYIVRQVIAQYEGYEVMEQVSCVRLMSSCLVLSREARRMNAGHMVPSASGPVVWNVPRRASFLNTQ